MQLFRPSHLMLYVQVQREVNIEAALRRRKKSFGFLF